MSVKVLKFNRRRPHPDAEDSDFQNTYLNNGVSSSITVTGYRLAFKFTLLVVTMGHNLDAVVRLVWLSDL